MGRRLFPGEYLSRQRRKLEDSDVIGVYVMVYGYNRYCLFNISLKMYTLISLYELNYIIATVQNIMFCNKSKINGLNSFEWSQFWDGLGKP